MLPHHLGVEEAHLVRVRSCLPWGVVAVHRLVAQVFCQVLGLHLLWLEVVHRVRFAWEQWAVAAEPQMAVLAVVAKRWQL